MARDEVLVTKATAPGPTALHVIAFATTLEADLVVVSAQHASSDVGALLNRMAYQVVEQAQPPVLAVLAPFTGLGRILLAYDGSSHSQTAARFLTRLPLPAGSETSVLHVLTDRPTVRVVPLYWPVGARMIRARTPNNDIASLDPAVVHRGQGILDDGLAILNGAGLAARGHLASGGGATAILQAARVNRAALIVAGSRGLGAVRGLLLGSVSRQLVHKAGSSVLIAREDTPELPKPSGIADNGSARCG